MKNEKMKNEQKPKRKLNMEDKKEQKRKRT
jgi:hypothetical protein